jgi:branched-chain amino acid transport system ATP-binding protein
MLKISGLSARIGSTQILNDISLTLPDGRMCGLIGRNGAGKTTLMKSLMGIGGIKTIGAMQLGDVRLDQLPAHRRPHLGIGYMPEDRRLVPQFTVEQNLMIPVYSMKIENAQQRLAWVYKLMPEVAEIRARRAIQLSGGQQKLAALGRALMAGKSLLLLDEPFEGVAPVLARRLAEVLADLKGEGVTVLVADSNESHAEGLLDSVFHIERGAIVEQHTAGLVETTG